MAKASVRLPPTAATSNHLDLAVVIGAQVHARIQSRTSPTAAEIVAIVLDVLRAGYSGPELTDRTLVHLFDAAVPSSGK